MKQDIVCLAKDTAHAQAWADAVAQDRDAGRIPRWIGAVVISVLADGSARMAYIKRADWAHAKEAA